MATSKRFLMLYIVFIAGYFNLEFSKAETVQVVGVIDPPYLIQDGQFYKGLIPDLLDRITEMIGEKYNLSDVTKYGILDSDKGEWSGMMGDVVSGKADVAGLLTVTSARANAVDFSYPILSNGPAIVLKRPETNRIRITDNLNSLFKPFDFTVWLMTILAFFVTGTVLYMISHFNPYEWRRMFKDREATLREAESFTCMNSFWFTISALAWQGYIRAPRSVGGRLVVTAWWFFVVLLLLAYVASLTNYLRIGPKPLEAEGYSKIRGFSDLAKTKDIHVLVVPSGSTEAYFKLSKHSTEQLIYKKIADTQEIFSINSTKDGIQKVRESPLSDTVMILESNTANYITSFPPCDLYMVSDNLITSHHSFAFSNGSIWTSKFNSALLRLRESGDLRMLEAKWFPKHCENNIVDSEASGFYDFQKFYKLDLGAFFGAVLILGAGLILGGLATVIEVCIYKWAETEKLFLGFTWSR